MNKIILIKLKLKTFTEQNALDYCLLNNINPNNITELTLFNNELTDISGIKIFKNLRYLDLSGNELTDISDIKYLSKLERLYIINSKLESNQIQYINSLNNLKILICNSKGFKDISVLKQLNKNIKIIK